MRETPHPELVYRAGGVVERARWWSESVTAPDRVAVADDHTTADVALRRAVAGEVLVYRGDWHNARQLLAAMGRRLRSPAPAGRDAAALYRAERERRRLEHEILTRLAVPLGPGWTCPLRRAPPLDPALSAAFGPPPETAALLPLREALGAIGAYEWLRRGVPVPALGGSVHPAYGVFAPVRGEYVDLVARALAERGPFAGATAFDVGTGTGVLAVLLARAGARVVATDLDPEAPRVVAGAVVSRLLAELGEHLAPGGEAWLVLSDLAERLGLRTAGDLPALFERAGLKVAFTLETRPAHPRARGGVDALARARAEERTRLYGLCA